MSTMSKKSSCRAKAIQGDLRPYTSAMMLLISPMMLFISSMMLLPPHGAPRSRLLLQPAVQRSPCIAGSHLRNEDGTSRRNRGQTCCRLCSNRPVNRVPRVPRGLDHPFRGHHASNQHCRSRRLRRPQVVGVGMRMCTVATVAASPQAAAARDSSPRRGAGRRGRHGGSIMPLCQLWVQQRPCAALSGGALQLSQNRRRWMELPQGLAALRLELRFVRCFRSRR